MLEEHVANQLDGQLFPYLPSTDGADANGTGKPAAIVPSSFRSAPTPPPGPMQSASGSLRSQRPNWHRAGTTGSSIASSTTGVGSLRDGSRGPAAFNGRDANRQRLIIFVAGGVTYSEMRSAYQVGQALGKEVIIGAVQHPPSSNSRILLISRALPHLSTQARLTSSRRSHLSKTSSRSASPASAPGRPISTLSTHPSRSTKSSLRDRKPSASRSCSTRCIGRRLCRPCCRPRLRQSRPPLRAARAAATSAWRAQHRARPRAATVRQGRRRQARRRRRRRRRASFRASDALRPANLRTPADDDDDP